MVKATTSNSCESTPLDTINEASLIDSLKAGEEQGFRTIHLQYFQPLCFFASQLINDLPEAQDIVTETFIKLWAKCNECNMPKSIKGFLYLTTKNACLNFLRDKKRLTASQRKLAWLLEKEGEFVLTKICKAELFKDIHYSIEQLPRKPLRIIKEVFFNGKKTKEISNELNMREANVLLNKHRGLRSLRDFLQKNDLLPAAAALSFTLVVIYICIKSLVFLSLYPYV